MNASAVEEYLNNPEIMRVREYLDALMQERERNTLTIAFCGIFSSGKSSLINAVLNQEFKLPTGREPVTKFVTRIEYGSEFRAYYVSGNQKVSIEEDNVKQIVRGKLSLPDQCREIVLQMPADILKPNVVFLDTPGYEDNKALEEITREAVRSADAAVFCCNADHFGRKFEQAYFQELEDSLGNFCVVVNHTDVIHTDEEFARLEEYVRKMVMGRGKKLLKNIITKTAFYTVGAGKYMDLDGLDTCLQELQDAGDDDWRMLKLYADKNRLRYGLNQISPVVKDNIQNGTNLFYDLDNELSAAREELAYQYETECQDVEKAIASLKRFIYDSLNKQTDIVQEKLENLEKEGKHEQFVQAATNILFDCYMKLPGDIKAWKQNKPLLKGKNLDIFSTSLRDAINLHYIPAPEGTRVKNRGFLGALAVSTVVSALTFSPYIDDGYDMEYHGYAANAVNGIKKWLLPRFDRCIDAYLRDQRKASMPPVPEQDTKILEKVFDKIKEWREIEQKINDHTPKSEEINVQPERKRIAIVGAYASGKTSLINALTKSDFLSTGPLPMGMIATVLKGVEADNREKIICTYYSPLGEYFDDFEKYSDKEISREQLHDFTLEHRGINYQSQTDDPKYITIYSKKIPTNIEYVDLPGSIISDWESDGFAGWYSSWYADWYSKYYSIKEFLESDAIIYTVNGCMGLLKNDLQIIKEFLPNEKNIFFAITQIDMLDDSERALLETCLQNQLSFLFMNSRGEFHNYLYHNRVFYVSARSSMNTRLGRETQLASGQKMIVPDHTTGIPDLERALYNYL